MAGEYLQEDWNWRIALESVYINNIICCSSFCAVHSFYVELNIVFSAAGAAAGASAGAGIIGIEFLVRVW